MDYGKLLSDTWQAIRQRPFLIWLGMLAATGNEALNTYTRLTIGNPQQLLEIDPQQLLTVIEARLGDTSWQLSVAFTLFFILLIIWLVSTIAEGGLIATVGTNQPKSFAEAARAGLRLLWRFIIVDTIIFFPLFVLALSILLIVSGTFIGVAVSMETRTTPVMNTFLWMAACVIPLTCLMLPVGILTFLSRTIAFRAAALDNHKARATLRHSWQIFKRHLTTILITGVIVIALRTAVGLISTILTTPLTLITQSTTNPAATLSTEVAITILSLIIAGALHTFTSALWTNFYLKLGTTDENP